MLKLLAFPLVFGLFHLQALASVKSKLDQILAKQTDLIVSVNVQDLKKAKNLYQYNPHYMMTPASTVKVVTALAALDYLGSDFTFKTSIFKKNEQFYLKFTGDPTLTKIQLNNLLAYIPGSTSKIIIDDRDFNQGYKAEGWTVDSNQFCYSAPSSTITINNNCFQIGLARNEILTNNAAFVKIKNSLSWSEEESCLPELSVRKDNFYQLTGCVDQHSANLKLNIAFQDPRLMIRGFLGEFFKNSPEIIFAKMPKDAELIVQHQSESLPEIISVMLRDSNNLIADNLLKTLVFNYYQVPGDFAYATSVIYNILADKYNYQLQKIKLVDGSGVSRYNLMDSSSLVNLVRIFYLKYGNLLPKVGLFNQVIGMEDVYGKTGTLSGIQNLIGITPSGKVFAILINGVTKKDQAKALIVELVKQINNL